MKQIIFLFLTIIVISCKSDPKDANNIKQEIPEKSIAKQHVNILNVDSDLEPEVENWEELKNINSFLKKFKKVSPNEALSNALELRDLVKSLKDSVKPAIFDVPSFNARVNVLENETLRLADLTLIPAITSDEVHKQVDKTIIAFSAVNSKINSLLSKKRFEEEIDIEIDYIGIDSTMIDSVSRKSIELKKEMENTKSVLGKKIY